MTLALELAAMQQGQPAPAPRELAGEAPQTDEPSPTPPYRIEALGALERGANTARATIDQLAPRVLAGELHPDIALPKNTDTAHIVKQLDTVRLLAANPNAKADWIARQTEDLAEHAPQTAMEAAQVLSRGIDYLAANAPAPRATTVFNQDSTPSRDALLQWSRLSHLVSSPLDAIAAGGITSRSMEALQAVYPALHGALRSAVTNELAEKGSPQTVAGRRQTSLVLGLEDGDSLAANQAAIASTTPGRPPAPQSGEPAEKPRGGKVPRSLGSTFETSSQRLANHSLGSKY